MWQHRYYEWGVYFVTFNTLDRVPYFQYSSLCDLFIEELILAKQEKKFDLFAFCVNYDHVHLLIWPNESIWNISQVIQFFKRHFSRNANIILWYQSADDIINDPKGAGNGYCQLNKKILRRREEFFAEADNDIPKFSRQKSFHDHIIRNYADFYAHYRYAMDNYLKHGLPDDRRYTWLRYPKLIDSLDV